MLCVCLALLLFVAGGKVLCVGDVDGRDGAGGDVAQVSGVTLGPEMGV